MKISKAGIELIKRWEGCRLKVYKDPGGVATIGWGHAYWNGSPTITQEVADMLLEQDLAKFEKKVMEYDKVYGWNQNEFDALVSFAYNIGSIRQLTADGSRSRGEIAKKIPEYCNMTGKRVQGLVDRRMEEKALFLKPIVSEQPAIGAKSVDEVAKEVVKGLWGNGEDRKRRLKEAGYDYHSVQNRVNEIMKDSKKSNEEIAKEVYQGLWGNGEDRKRRLKEAGYDFQKIQEIVNKKYYNL